MTDPDVDDGSIFPLLDYRSGVAEGTVALSLEMATDPDQYEARMGVWVSTAMQPDNAMDLGRELISLDHVAKANRVVN